MGVSRSIHSMPSGGIRLNSVSLDGSTSETRGSERYERKWPFLAFFIFICKSIQVAYKTNCSLILCLLPHICPLLSPSPPLPPPTYSGVELQSPPKPAAHLPALLMLSFFLLELFPSDVVDVDTEWVVQNRNKILKNTSTHWHWKFRSPLAIQRHWWIRILETTERVFFLICMQDMAAFKAEHFA